jgi:DNA-binding GntR family transcriptional regulator
MDVVPDIEEVDLCQMPFYEMMQQRAAQKIQKVVQMIEISEMTSDAAAILKSGTGEPMLLLHRLLVGTDGKPLAYTRLMGDGKKYKLQTELIQIA